MAPAATSCCNSETKPTSQNHGSSNLDQTWPPCYTRDTYGVRYAIDNTVARFVPKVCTCVCSVFLELGEDSRPAVEHTKAHVKRITAVALSAFQKKRITISSNTQVPPGHSCTLQKRSPMG